MEGRDELVLAGEVMGRIRVERRISFSYSGTTGRSSLQSTPRFLEGEACRVCRSANTVTNDQWRDELPRPISP